MLAIAIQYKWKGIDHDKEKNSQSRPGQANQWRF
jgi:hypothetical protein